MKLRDRALRLAASLALPLAACGGEPPEVVAAEPPVVVVAVELADLDERIEASGELRAQDRAAVASELAGRITSVLREEGEPVGADEVLLEIDPERRKLELDSARAGLDEARAARDEQKRELARRRQLHEKGIASDAQLDQTATQLALAQSRYEAARARAGVAERALEDASVRAPFAGLLALRKVSRGEYVQPGQTLFELVALDPIEAEFHLSERDSARVEDGQHVVVRVSPYPDEEFEGTVSMISPTIDAQTRTLRVKALLPNPEGRLRPGLFARVDLGIARREGVMLIPEEAVLQRADGQVVFRTTDGDRVERVMIETGAHWDGRVEVTAGLASGDRVVTRGQAGLVDGIAVSPRNPDGTLLTGAVSAAPAEAVSR
jgi:membrane fusion protein (multidrug efflux system)